MEFSSSICSGRSVALEIDLNEAPLPSPRGGGGGTADHRCGSCGELEGEMVVCGECGRKFHVECLGVRQEQRVWKCFDCLIECGGGGGKRQRRAFTAGGGGRGFGSGLFDMNVSPPREGGEEDLLRRPELGLAATFPKTHDTRGNPFLGFALSSPMTPDMRFITSGFPSPNIARMAQLNIGNPNQRANLVYLQALRDYVSEMRGALGDGWRVRFEFSETTFKTSAIYCAPNGTRFDSMSEVANHLGLLPYETDEKLQKRSQSTKRAKEASRSSRANSLREHKNMARSRAAAGGGRNTVDVDSTANVSYGSQSFLDGFPVQFEDFFVISPGKIDPRPSFHDHSQIWPVGYKSVWHDKLTGSIFVCNVLDGGDGGPIFRVHRCPCGKQPIPNASRVLCGPGPGHDDSSVNRTFHEDFDDVNVHAIFTEDDPPRLDDYDSSITRLTAESDFRKDDVVGEFSVEGQSISSAWENGVEAFLHACRKAYSVNKALNFWCNHSVEERNINENASYGSDLGRFCYFFGPVNEIPDVIRAPEEFEASCEAVRRWLERDRFGLDVGFVQELVERLPEVGLCSGYKSLGLRSQSLTLQTVGSGFFAVISKNDLQREMVSSSLRKDRRRPSPPGDKLDSDLPPHLVGDVLQAYEICLRFYEVLGQAAPPSRQELEYELMNPWVDDSNETRNTKACEGDVTSSSSDSKTHGEDLDDHGGDAAALAGRCTGVKLAGFHMAVLKVVVEEVLARVKEIFDPFGCGGVEPPSRSRKGRKKEAVSDEKTGLGMVPVNEFTWPEIARRYVLVVLAAENNLESSEVLTRECGEVFLCLYGDGGTLCGSLTGVAAMEADATVLAEASKKVFSSVKSKITDLIIDQKDAADTVDSAKDTNALDTESPEWVQVLEPVRKLPTNVGARIRKCVHESLTKNPPEWAEKILVHSISKEVYKGNASGPTKRAVISVLEKVMQENPQQKPPAAAAAGAATEKKEKEKSGGVKTLSEVVMKRCRMVLRTVAAADEDRLIFNLLAKGVLKPNDPDDAGLLGYPTMVSRPLDFRTVDLRLAAGVYGASHESFIEDVREVWQNLRIACRDKPDYLDLVETLSEKFEESYEEEVLNLVNRITESGNTVNDSSNEKELNEILVDVGTEGPPLPAAPWEDGVCKVCGMDKDDDSVLLCDKCDSEYHTYCLDPPLARIPEGNWYCPSCLSSPSAGPPRDERCGTRALGRWRRGGGKRRLKEFTRSLVETLAPLADMMELIEYWELGIEERVFLFKFLCDEVLSSGVVRTHLGPDSVDLEKKLRKLHKESKNRNKRKDMAASASEDKRNDGEEEGPQVGCSSQSQTEENEEARPVGPDQESGDIKSKDPGQGPSLHDKIVDLESKMSKLVVRREYLGRDSDGRLYWVFGSPERVVVSGPQSGGKPSGLETSETHTLWTCYRSETDVEELVRWLRDDDVKERELKEAIVQWQRSKPSDPGDPQVGPGSGPGPSLYTKARAALEKKFGSFGSAQYSKQQARKGKTVKLYRCDCLELAGPARHHCPSCHSTFLTNEELEGHDDGKCEKRLDKRVGNSTGTRKSKRESDGSRQLAASTDHRDSPECPFNFEEIRAKFCVRTSLKDDVKDIGLIGSNGTPTLIHEIPPRNTDSALLGPGTRKGVGSRDRWAFLQSADKQVDRARPKGTSGKSSSKNRSHVRICQSSLKPLTGKVCEILRWLKINLLDIETALPEEAFRPSRGSFDRMSAWRAFVKSAQSIYEMVQATIVLEDTIKTEYLRKEWWYWSSPSTAARISTVSALALRIYALDAAIHYEAPPAPADPVTPRPGRKAAGKSNPRPEKDSSEKSNHPKSSGGGSTDVGVSRPKTRSKKRSRESGE